jgi:hypothetical protein
VPSLHAGSRAVIFIAVLCCINLGLDLALLVLVIRQNQRIKESLRFIDDVNEDISSLNALNAPIPYGSPPTGHS